LYDVAADLYLREESLEQAIVACEKAANAYEQAGRPEGKEEFIEKAAAARRCLLEDQNTGVVQPQVAIPQPVVDPMVTNYAGVRVRKDSLIPSALKHMKENNTDQCLRDLDLARELFFKLRDGDGAGACVGAQMIVRLAIGDIQGAHDCFYAEIKKGYFVRSPVRKMVDCLVRGIRNESPGLRTAAQEDPVLKSLCPELQEIIRGLCSVPWAEPMPQNPHE
jgi:hypothetical protein